MNTPSSLLYLSVIALCAILLMGCPVATSYPIVAVENALPFNKQLIGTWLADNDGSGAKKINIEKDETNSYVITIIEKGEMYSPETTTLKAWLGKYEKNTYFILQEYDAEHKQVQEKYYLFEIKSEKNKITTQEVSFKKGGIDAIESIESFQQEITASTTMEGFWGDKSVWIRQ